MNNTERASSGFSGLDAILDDFRIGDNVVWKIDTIDDYRFFVQPFVRTALEQGRNVVYMRFAQHEPVVDSLDGVTVYQLDAYQGFESFAAKIHAIITDEGRGAFYVFDCLSNLLSAWATDLMIGNFFRVTCPYLYEMETVAYFSILRYNHSLNTIARIRETTQLLLEVFNWNETIHIHPLKVVERHSPTMFLPHYKDGDRFVPMTESYNVTSLSSNQWREGMDFLRRYLDYWDRLFMEAEKMAGHSAPEQRQQMVDTLCRVMIGNEERMLSLAQHYFTIEDLLDIKSRMIGTGYIGGKAVGMLLARNILQRDAGFQWRDCLEAHDSFYVGTDVYYSFIVHNGLWPLLMQQKTEAGYFAVAEQLKTRMQEGEFPAEIRDELQDMLEYFGQYPIIVRSSSLLEDSFGNAFAGKYDSFFLVNQGSPEDRCEKLYEAIRNIFASTMSIDALTYRRQRGLHTRDEKMALLIQRVSGSYRNQYYFPDLAGVAISYNTYVWNREIDPRAGMMRMVMGLGTRAVDRVEGDYPRIVALGDPLRQPHKGIDDTRKFSQRDVDLLNIAENTPQTVSLLNLTEQGLPLHLDLFGIRDEETTSRLKTRSGGKSEVWLLTFDTLLSQTPLAARMQNMLQTLENAYQYPVDVEFTINFNAANAMQFNLVQCRPLQTSGLAHRIELPAHIREDRIIIRSEGQFMGGSISQSLELVIVVDPERYVALTQTEKYEMARLVGQLNRKIGDRSAHPALLLGPGRWGTSTPSLGVPVSFSEINNMTALGEVAFSSGNLTPDLSFGTHFFQDLVESEIFYMALFPEQFNCVVNTQWLNAMPDGRDQWVSGSGNAAQALKVCVFPGRSLRLAADVISQQLLCYVEEGAQPLKS